MKIINDKILHFSACAVVAAAISVVIALAGASVVASCLAGFLGAVACGGGKEYGDSKAHGNLWSWPDIFADVAGAVVGCSAGLMAF